MITRREQRGPCLIEARALDLHHRRHWQPWLRLTRQAGEARASRTFERLKPVFGTEEAALHYAAELGRSLADQGSTLDPAGCNRGPAKWSLHQASVQSCEHRSHKSQRRFATATYLMRALARLFVRAGYKGGITRAPHVERYFAAAASHAQCERRMRETEPPRECIEVTFSH